MKKTTRSPLVTCVTFGLHAQKIMGYYPTYSEVTEIQWDHYTDLAYAFIELIGMVPSRLMRPPINLTNIDNLIGNHLEQVVRTTVLNAIFRWVERINQPLC